ncbi:PH domain-containing protein [Wenzhouxiangella marina]|uniref:Membrane-flanked domain protein n=1 Tax=Wenzhouxiangella marina TaxID=1579979 RepID=A0A0K0XVC8_9GAMM|nr:PH domain-containing protein [Wenzhouxiangella marina]AKS41664.1 Membrane-flanked domain protein [Wenzhouxiangella marina]MBB6086575.1 putative membrane protein [Wenzhouxiangella marina]
MRKTKILMEAEILPGVVRYHLWGVAILSICMIFAIPLLPITLPLAAWAMRRYYDRLEVVLTRRDLLVRRGIFNREEKTIPLEKITDLALYQGPLMRLFDIKGMRVETAGQSSTGALVSVVGIRDVDAFRDAVLEQRDRISDDDEAPARPSTAAAAELGSDTRDILISIRDSLQRIEAGLTKDKGPTG